MVYSARAAARRSRCGPHGGVMKNNVKVLVTLAVAVALFFVVKHYFPLTGAGR